MTNSENEALDIIMKDHRLKTVFELATMRERRSLYQNGVIGNGETPQSILDDIEVYSREIIALDERERGNEWELIMMS